MWCWRAAGVWWWWWCEWADVVINDRWHSPVYVVYNTPPPPHYWQHTSKICSVSWLLSNKTNLCLLQFKQLYTLSRNICNTKLQFWFWVTLCECTALAGAGNWTIAVDKCRSRRQTVAGQRTGRHGAEIGLGTGEYQTGEWWDLDCVSLSPPATDRFIPRHAISVSSCNHHCFKHGVCFRFAPGCSHQHVRGVHQGGDQRHGGDRSCVCIQHRWQSLQVSEDRK